MLSCDGIGFMTVAAVSGSIAFVTLQLHKRLGVEFMKKVELELGVERYQPKKKVRFAEDVIEPSSNNEEYRKRRSRNSISNGQVVGTVTL